MILTITDVDSNGRYTLTAEKKGTGAGASILLTIERGNHRERVHISHADWWALCKAGNAL